ncbi:TolC family protein [Luteolibacter pohnpeiensis]|uniref:TolC family protein n=1 Tax=Luteolibacter pohnpeiensis TaxID=454153 RepID=A0A934S5S7_9BACT|nr:TolC family protein [Luteolibacter pohnpeiensis]MBK1882388.1 TolC family protein [Luteolibacter pohnpeiensis]
MHYLFRLALGAFLTLPAYAAPALIITLGGVADRVHSQNPSLAAARLQIAQAIGRSKQAGLLDNPQLETGIEHNQNFNEGRIEIGLSQRFPVTGRLRLEKEISSISVRKAEAEVREVERQLVEQARLTVVDILSTQAKRRLLTQQSNLADQFTKSLTKAAEKGEGSLLDAASAKLEAATLAVEMRQLDAAEAAKMGELKPLLGIEPNAPILVNGELDQPILPEDTVKFNRRPDYQIAEFEIESARQGIDLEVARRLDDVEAGFFAAAERSEDAPEGFENEAIVGLRFQIALPFWNRNQGAIDAATATHERRKLEAAALQQKIQSDADSNQQQMKEWARLIHELDQELLPLATQQSEAMNDAFSKGLSDLQTVFRAREKRMSLESSKIDAIRQFHLARVRYESAVGNY